MEISNNTNPKFSQNKKPAQGSLQLHALGSNHRRVYTEGPRQNPQELAYDDAPDEDEEEERVSLFENEEENEEEDCIGEDGVPIYSNSGIPQILD